MRGYSFPECLHLFANKGSCIPRLTHCLQPQDHLGMHHECIPLIFCWGKKRNATGASRVCQRHFSLSFILPHAPNGRSMSCQPFLSPGGNFPWKARRGNESNDTYSPQLNRPEEKTSFSGLTSLLRRTDALLPRQSAKNSLLTKAGVSRGGSQFPAFHSS